MSLTPSLNNVFYAGVLASVLLGGCSDYDSSFVYSDRTRDLIPEAQDGFQGQEVIPGLKAQLDERFGNPQSLKAWVKLPVDFGGTKSSVVGVTAVGKETQVTLSGMEDVELPASATTVQFLTGACEGQTAAITEWDPTTGIAVLAATLESLPAEGDLCSIDRAWALKSGRVLYMKHCSHCHGTSGDGNGPTAQYLNPRPRDYRNGVFKFTSTNDMSKASRGDLTRILKNGIPGTYMPSFLLLKNEEMYAIVEYVRFLGLRGEYERMLVNELYGDFSVAAFKSRTADERSEDILKELKELLAGDFSESATTLGEELGEQWAAADGEEAAIVPNVPRVADDLKSRQRGRELYLSKTLNCADCHGIDGAGNGPQTLAFEKNPVTNELYHEAGLHDLWDNLNQPRNLHTGIYRGGRRPYDLFCRVYAGIKGSRMPSFKNTPHEDIWHIVNYVLSLPYESEPGATGVAVPTTAVAVP